MVLLLLFRLLSMVEPIGYKGIWMEEVLGIILVVLQITRAQHLHLLLMKQQ